jgi:hypothetical protein
MSYDLTIHTQKSSTIPALEHVRSVHDDLRRSLNASGAWFELGLHQLRAADAKWFMENDGLFDPQCKRAFEAFCREQQIVSDPLSEETALRFMLHQDGAHLASVILPSDDASCAAVFRALVDFARRSGLRIGDPQAGRDVDLERPGDYPPLWKT